MSKQIDLDTGFTHTSFFNAGQFCQSAWKKKKEKYHIHHPIQKIHIGGTKWNISNSKKNITIQTYNEIWRKKKYDDDLLKVGVWLKLNENYD